MPIVEVSSDEILRSTDEDAAISRLSAVHHAYMPDPYAPFFVHPSMQSTRRSPLINRGTFLRIHAIDQVLAAFLRSTPAGPRQVVNFGAGTDTRFFRFKTFHSELLSQNKYFEIDFQETILHKIAVIRKRKAMLQLLEEVHIDSTSLLSKELCLISAELRDWPAALNVLLRAGFHPDLPTLFISECVFIYIQPDAVDTLIQWMGTLPSAAFVCYEQILPEDPFGSMMLKNLKTRDIFLPGIHTTPTLEAHQKRLAPHFDSIFLMDMNTFWSEHVSEDEKHRVAKLEIFDEIEEWQLICKHYCLVVATRNRFLPGWSQGNTGHP